MGVTLNGHRVTTAKVTIPSWGCWHANVCLDGDHVIAGGERVTLVMADLTLIGTVVSGGAALGRSYYRIVAGAGGWGRTIRSWSWSDDAGVTFAKAIGDAAREAGETLAAIPTTLRTGPAWTREEAPASLTLNTLSPGAWYVDEAGVTHVGARTPGTLPAKVTRVAPVDFARGRVELASDSIAAILPGVVIDGLTAVDVQHEASPEGGIRTTVWGGSTGSVAESMRKLGAALDPDRSFRGPTEYRVDVASGSRWNLQPIRVSSGMPYLKNVPVRPGVAGCEAELALGSHVIVEFLDADPSRPFISGFADVDDAGFQPNELTLHAGGSAGGEHVMTVEACALLIYNVIQSLTLVTVGPWTGLSIQPLLTPAILTALAAQSAPAPPGLVAQIAANAALASGMVAGTAPSNAMGPLSAGLALLSTKTANDSGFFPSLGCKAVKAG